MAADGRKESSAENNLSPQEASVVEGIKKGSQKLVKTVFNALSLNPIIKEIPENELLSSISEVISKVGTPPRMLGESPSIQVKSHSAVISWQTDKKSNGLVAIAAEDNFHPERKNPYTTVIGNPDEQVNRHSVVIDNLIPETVYHFQVRSKTKLGFEFKSPDLTFKTPSLNPEISQFKFEEVGQSLVKFSWQTNLPTKSEIELINSKTGEKTIKEDNSYLNFHTFIIGDLIPGNNYTIQITAQDEKGRKSISPVYPFTTLLSKDPPQITDVRISNFLIPGNSSRVQTIVRWKTDKPSTSRVYYQEGANIQQKLLKLSTSLNKKLVRDHIVITTTLHPGRIYQLKIESIDALSNVSYSKSYVILTPKPRENIVDIITKTFEQTFGFLRKVK